MTVNQNIYKFSEIIHNNPEISVDLFTCTTTNRYSCIITNGFYRGFASDPHSMFDAFMQAYEMYQSIHKEPYYFGEDT